MDKKSGFFTQYFAAISASLGGFAVGNIEALFKQKVVQLDENEALDSIEFLYLVLPIGAALSAVVAFILLDLIGRKWLIILTNIPLITSYFLLGFSSHVAMKYVSSLIMGFCSGMVIIVVPIFIGELAEKGVRGRLGCIFPMMICAGGMFAHCFGFATDLLWSTMPLTAIPIASCITLLFVRESPVFLYKLGLTEHAMKALKFYRVKNYDTGPELEEMDQYTEMADESTWQVLMKMATFKVFSILLGLNFLRYMTGQTTIKFFGQSIFLYADAGFNNNGISNILHLCEMIGIGVCSFIVDKIGRRLLWVISLASMCVTTGCMSIYYFIQIQNEEYTENVRFMPILCILFFMIEYGLATGTLSLVMNGELAPCRTKIFLIPAVFFILSGLQFLHEKYMREFAASLEVAGIFLINTLVSIGGIALILFCVIETKNMSLQEIQIKLGT